MEWFLVIFGMLACVAVFAGFLWVLTFLFAPDDHSGSDWYSDDEEI